MSLPTFSPLHRSAFMVFLLPLFILVVLVAGCSRDQHPELRQADSTRALAENAIEKGSIREARRFLHAAATLDGRHDRLAQLGEEYRLLAGIAISMAEFDSGFVYLDKSLEQYRSLAERPQVRSLTLEIASLHRLMGDERKAFTMYTEAIRLTNVFGDADGVREIQWAMLPCCRALDEVEEEGKIISDLLKHYTASGDIRGQAKVYYESGLSRLHRGDNDGAAENFLRTLTLAGQAGDSLLGITSLARLAYTYDRAGRMAEAFQTYTDGLVRTDVTRFAGRLRDEMLMRVGNAYLRNGQAQEAARFYRAALPTSIRRGNKLAEGYLFIQLGHCETSHDEAVKKYGTGLELLNSLASGRGRAYAELSLGLAFWKQRNFADAQSHLIAAVEASEKSVFVPPVDDVYRECEDAFTQSTGIPPYDALIDLLLQMGKNEEAFLYAQRRDGRKMYDILGALDIQTRDDRLNPLLGQVRRQRGERIGAERQLDRLLTEGPFHIEVLEGLQTRLSASASGLADAVTQVVQANPAFSPAVKISSLSVADAQRRLPPGAVLVEPFPTSRTLHLFVLTPAGLSVPVAAVEKKRIISTTREFISGLEQRGEIPDTLEYEQREEEERARSLSPILYSWFVRPVEGLLTGASKVLVVLPRELAPLPLHALSKKTGRLASPPLIEQQQVNYLPLVYALTFEGKTAAPLKDIVGAGHPGGTSWDVEYELRDIRAFFKDARFYFQHYATLAALQKERGDVLHLAVETGFSERAANNSFVMLSDGKSPDTFRQVRWGQLCLLSGFSTVIVSDIVEHRSGIEPSLAMMFLMNGAGAVELTSYTPARKTRKYFGEVFYTALLAGTSGQQALRQVQLEMIKNKEYAAPYIWAPFFCWGK